MVLVPMVFTLLLLSAVFNLAIRFLHSQVEHLPWLEKLYEYLLSLTGLTLPLVLVFGLIFICYRYLPLARPRAWHAVLGAALCTLAIFGLNAAFVKYVNLASYHIVYGSLGAVILLLFWVFLVFLVFFLFAQFVQVAGRIDVIALDKIIAPQVSAGGFGRWLEQSLFRGSGRIYSRYARQVRDKETIFSQGDQGTDIYYVLQGRVEILSGSPGLLVRRPSQ